MLRTELEIRPGQRRDLGSIVDIYNHYVEHSAATFEVSPVRPADRLDWFREHSLGGRHRLWVAVAAGSGVRGWATTSPFRSRAAYLTTVESSVYVESSSMGQGIGSRLYRSLFESIRSEDIERIVAGISLPNPASLALHHHFGFRHVGTFSRVGRKFGEYWDVAWFERPRKVPHRARRNVRHSFAGRPREGPTEVTRLTRGSAYG
ncbi:MAG: N-acetyltransferase family protein [Thermoplasmata archaeon]